MKYKILEINEKNIVEELNKEYKNGYEPIKFLEKNMATAYNSNTSYRVLFSKYLNNSDAESKYGKNKK